MGDWWMGIGLSVAGLAVLQGLLIGLQTWEHRRFARSRQRHPRLASFGGHAVLLVPCRGLDVGLEENLDRLFVQDYDDYELFFIVEDRKDPACPVIRRRMEAHPAIRSRLLFAGQAVDSGQKVHNLRVAVEHLPPETEYLAFVDADARPGPHWLHSLLFWLEQPGVGAATGYRWFMPERPTLANHLLYSLNCNITMLFNRNGPNAVWGGSWAIRREVFERLKIADAWDGTLSDDFVASRVLYDAGMRVAFEPTCVVASPIDFSMPQMLAFVRRQYMIGRFYAPLIWAMGFLLITFACLVFWGGLALAAWGLIAGAPWAWLPTTMCVLVYLLNAGRGLIRNDLAMRCFPEARESLEKAGQFDMVAGPLITLVNWAELVASLVGRQIDWRGITYRLFRGGRIAFVRRGPPPAFRQTEELRPPLESALIAEREAA
jgi:hypothetical protein